MRLPNPQKNRHLAAVLLLAPVSEFDPNGRRQYPVEPGTPLTRELV